MFVKGAWGAVVRGCEGVRSHRPVVLVVLF